jgi:hypothetical protein
LTTVAANNLLLFLGWGGGGEAARYGPLVGHPVKENFLPNLKFAPYPRLQMKLARNWNSADFCLLLLRNIKIIFEEEETYRFID